MPGRPSGGGDAAGARYGGAKGTRSGGGVSYSDIDGALLQDAVTAITALGDAILLGRTSDGGAYAVRFYSGGTSYAVYPSDAVALSELLQEALEAAQSA